MMNIGQRAYFVRQGRNQIEEECPDCAGKLAHHMVLGNGDEVDIPCDTCKRGYLGPSGVIQTYRNTAVVESCDIVSITTGSLGVTEYRVSIFWQNKDKPEEAGWSEQDFESDKLFGEKLLAQVAADRQTAKQVERYVKDKVEQHRSWAWHVNYHRKGIRENLRRNEHHEEQLAFARTKAKK